MINVHMSFWKKKTHFTRKKINFWETNLYFFYILGRTNNIQKNNYMFRRKKIHFQKKNCFFRRKIAFFEEKMHFQKKKITFNGIFVINYLKTLKYRINSNNKFYFKLEKNNCDNYIKLITKNESCNNYLLHFRKEIKMFS